MNPANDSGHLSITRFLAPRLVLDHGNVIILAFLRRNRTDRWQSHAGKTMFVSVKTRLLRPIVYLLVAAQLLLSAPVASALATSQPAKAMTADCAGEMAGKHDAGKCPCCPDGVSMSACLATCTAAAAVAPAVRIEKPPVHVDVSVTPPATEFASIADPPLKPPPIV